jgi:multidrug efflux system membrane fusion protein
MLSGLGSCAAQGPILHPVRRVFSGLVVAPCSGSPEASRPGSLCWQPGCRRHCRSNCFVCVAIGLIVAVSAWLLVRTIAHEGSGIRSYRSLGKLISLLIIAVGISIGLFALDRRARFPSTDDATIDADIVHVAAAVGGRIIDLPVAENVQVARGDVLFRIDPIPYQRAVQQAQADLELAEATLDTQHRVIFTQQSAASVARDQIQRATTNLDGRARSRRLRPLAAKAMCLSSSWTRKRPPADAVAIGAGARTGSRRGTGDRHRRATSTVRARGPPCHRARALDDATVRATHAGRVVGLTISTGEMVVPSQSVFTLINTEEWYAVGNFSEFNIPAIAVGDCATAYSMINRNRPIKGVVQGIGSGVLDEERINLPRSVPYVERSLNWVRVAQRFPVRVRLEAPPAELMRLGASAIVEVKHGAECR